MENEAMTPLCWLQQQYPDDTPDELAARALDALAMQSHYGKHVLWSLVKKYELDAKRGPMDLAKLGGLDVPLRTAKLWTNGEHSGNYAPITSEQLDAVLRGVQSCEAEPARWDKVTKREKQR